MNPIIQIAGVRDLAEARMLARAGATHVGIPLRLDVHAPDVSEAEAAAIVRGLGNEAAVVCITYAVEPRELAELADFLVVAGMQLHGPVSPGQAAELRRLRPGLFLIKSLVVAPGRREALHRDVEAFAPYVDAFLTDTFDPASGASGATGKTHDWSVSRELVLSSPRPVILAGGLTPENVARAVLEVRPAGVDAHTGLEDASGRKVETLARRFAEQARAAWAVMRSEGPVSGGVASFRGTG
ncbi:phosphoribosylanthranilate isomerase [Desulfovibrio aminophilus]|jgi:phosphoribosylanthranilate isomerase|uniref:phosphoribosylanthranilate isomerase n=1 Tax=Desulfovibrio aminophilus TaxID=81425 RepID=UPI000418A35A|nr:phosphoribosylanthranilate isomerase [Desulfovibrio aminophilus]